MAEIHTYPEMNAKISGILRISDNPADLYAAQYIDELRAENEKLLYRCKQAEELIDHYQAEEDE